MVMNEPRVRKVTDKTTRGAAHPAAYYCTRKKKTKTGTVKHWTSRKKVKPRDKSRAEPTRRRGLRIKQIMEPI